MNWLFIGGILLFVAILLVTVAVHEAGHMAAAKKLGLDVPEYSVGFGPKLFTIRTKKTAYSLRAIPLGGFVIIHDERYPEKSYERIALSRVKPWKRQIVFLAGPAVNIVIGVVVLFAVLLSTPYNKPSNYVGELYNCSNAAGCGAREAGLKQGDKIVSIDGVPVKNFKQLGEAKAGKTVLDTVVVERDGRTVTVNDMKLKFDPKTKVAYMGIQATKPTYRSFADASTFVTDAFKKNFVGILHMPEKLPKVFANIFSGDKGADDPSSVVAASKTYGDLAANTQATNEVKLQTFVYYGALFNLGIGLINLIPILPLDGGRMWIALCDTIRLRYYRLRKKKYQPVTQRMFSYLSATSAIAVFGFMALIILSDVSAWASGSI